MKWKIRCFFIRFRVALSPQSASGPDVFVETRTFSRKHPRLGRCRFNCCLLCLHRSFYIWLVLERDWLVATDQISDESAARSELFQPMGAEGTLTYGTCFEVCPELLFLMEAEFGKRFLLQTLWNCSAEVTHLSRTQENNVNTLFFWVPTSQKTTATTAFYWLHIGYEHFMVYSTSTKYRGGAAPHTDMEISTSQTAGVREAPAISQQKQSGPNFEMTLQKWSMLHCQSEKENKKK